MERSARDRGGIIVAFIITLVVNWLANAVPLGGQGTGQVSAQYSTLFTPAGFTFAIWGLIYTLLSVFVIWQALPGQRANRTLASISGLFIANCLANAAWIFAWHYDLLWLSLFIMLGMLATLALIYRKLDATRPTGFREGIVLRLPFSIYTGWITVATIANLSCVQFAMGWDSAILTQQDWTLLKLSVAGAIGATVIFRTGDIAYVLVIAWAAFGIASKQTGTPEVVGAATVLAALVVLLAVASMVRR